MEIQVRELSGPEELEKVEALQMAVWGRDELDTLPARMMIAIQHEGGLVGGAFAPKTPDGAMRNLEIGNQLLIGFVFGFPTRDPQKQHSNMLGVLQAYRHTPAALLLKRFQRSWCLERGIVRVDWTFDPMRGVNANFNLRKLGAAFNKYLPNRYGYMKGINAGAPSDRVLAEWELLSERALARLSGPAPEPDLSRAVQINQVQGDTPVGFTVGLETTSPRLLVQIPEDWQQILDTSTELAIRWREHSRELFGHYFSQGYRATEFVRGPNRYLLERTEKPDGA